MIMVIILSFSQYSGEPGWHALSCRRVARNFSERTPYSARVCPVRTAFRPQESPAGSFWEQYIMFLCKINSFLFKIYFLIVRYHHIAVSC